MSTATIDQRPKPDARRAEHRRKRRKSREALNRAAEGTASDADRQTIDTATQDALRDLALSGDLGEMTEQIQQYVCPTCESRVPNDCVIHSKIFGKWSNRRATAVTCAQCGDQHVAIFELRLDAWQRIGPVKRINDKHLRRLLAAVNLKSLEKVTGESVFDPAEDDVPTVMAG